MAYLVLTCIAAAMYAAAIDEWAWVPLLILLGCAAMALQR